MTYRELFFDIKRKLNKPSDEVVFTLLSYNYNMSKNLLILHFDEQCDIDQRIGNQINRLNNEEPLQYVINEAYFLGDKFYVSNDVLIPRQETEQLVIDTENYANTLFFGKKINVLEIGTGSGCIAIELSKRLNCNITATDISDKALQIAKRNAVGTNNIQFLKHDIFNPLNLNKVDVIVSNPPYIKNESTVDQSTLKFEPHLALFATPQTKFYEEIMKKSQSLLNDKGLLAFEIDEDMQESLEQLIKKYFPSSSYEFKNDIYNKLRFLYIIK